MYIYMYHILAFSFLNIRLYFFHKDLEFEEVEVNSFDSTLETLPWIALEIVPRKIERIDYMQTNRTQQHNEDIYIFISRINQRPVILKVWYKLL